MVCMLIHCIAKATGPSVAGRALKLPRVLMSGQADGLGQVNAAVNAVFTQNLYLITRYNRQSAFLSFKGEFL